MGTVGVRELKNRLTHYLRRTRQGEDAIVTQRGTPVALLQSLEKARPAAGLDARLAQLAARGVLTLPGKRRRRPFRPIKIAGPPLSRTILADRR